MTESEERKMTKEQVLESNSLKQRFIKDTKLPLNLLRNPYFEQRLNLYSNLYKDILDKWSSYLSMLEDFNSEQDYFEHYSSVKDGIIESVKGSEAYDRFNSIDMNGYAVPHQFRQLPSKDIFKPTFDHTEFISIDMKKANFSSMSKYDPAIFSGCETWEEFVGQFTTYPHIINSKYIREASLGNCNPKRHITYEKYLMSVFLDEYVTYLESLDIESKIAFFSNDEVVFNVTDISKEQRYLMKSAVQVNIDTSIAPIELHVNEFRLYHISELDGYLELNLDTNEIAPKSINNFMMPFLIRAMIGEEPKEEDMVFMHPNVSILSKFLEAPVFTLPEELKL